MNSRPLMLAAAVVCGLAIMGCVSAQEAARARRTYSIVQFLLGQTTAEFKDDCLDGCGIQLWDCEKTPQRGCGRQ